VADSINAGADSKSKDSKQKPEDAALQKSLDSASEDADFQEKGDPLYEGDVPEGKAADEWDQTWPTSSRALTACG
jgi:hypothetical protein